MPYNLCKHKYAIGQMLSATGASSSWDLVECPFCPEKPKDWLVEILKGNWQSQYKLGVEDFFVAIATAIREEIRKNGPKVWRHNKDCICAYHTFEKEWLQYLGIKEGK